MPLDLEITRAWEKSNECGIALAHAVRDMRGTPDAQTRSNALGALDEARKAAIATISLIDLQIADIARTLQTR